jgi:hypothetical protein
MNLMATKQDPGGGIDTVIADSADAAITAGHAVPDPHALAIPIVIGVMGKRKIDHAHEDAIRSALAAALDMVRRRCPMSPLYVVCSLGEGVDQIVAETALAADVARLVVVLPMEPDLFRLDFAKERLAVPETGQSSAAERFDTVWASADTRIRRIVLPALAGADPEAMGVDGAASRPQRTLHYEAASLYIAENCHLLLAVLPDDEAPGSVGGTARALAYKVTGRMPGPADPEDPKSRGHIEIFEARAFGPDGAARAALLPFGRRLRALCPALRQADLLDPPEHGFAWQMWPRPSQPKPMRARNSAAVAEPVGPWQWAKGMTPQSEHGDAPARELALTWQAIERFNTKLAAHLRTHAQQPWDDAEAVLNGSKLKRDAQARSADRPEMEAAANLLGFSLAEQPASFAALRHLLAQRRAVADLQRRAKDRYRMEAIRLSLFFFAAVFAFELLGKNKQGWAFLAYGLAIAGSVFVFWRMRRQRLANIAEDYRAVAEALRVQAFWQIAGLPDRVEDRFLAGASGPLGRVRKAVAIILARIRWDHGAMLPPPHPGFALWGWLAEQRDYFRSRRAERERQLERYEFNINASFVAAIGVVASLSPKLLDWPDFSTWWFVPAALVFAPFVAARFWAEPPSGWPGARAIKAVHRWLRRWTWLPLWIPSLLAIGYLAGALVLAAAEWVGGILPGWATAWLYLTPDGWTLLLAGGLIAYAGLASFYREKMAWEAEAHNYAEMGPVAQAAVAEARRLLAIRDRATPDADAAAKALDTIFRDYGGRALDELADWLRAHRERPIEQAFAG